MIDYTIKRAGVFNLRVALPGGYRVEQVSGDNILATGRTMMIMACDCSK